MAGPGCVYGTKHAHAMLRYYRIVQCSACSGRDFRGSSILNKARLTHVAVLA